MKTSKAARGRKDMRAHLAHGVYDVFPVPEPTKESRFFLLNACARLLAFSLGCVLLASNAITEEEGIAFALVGLPLRICGPVSIGEPKNSPLCYVTC